MNPVESTTVKSLSDFDFTKPGKTFLCFRRLLIGSPALFCIMLATLKTRGSVWSLVEYYFFYKMPISPCVHFRQPPHRGFEWGCGLKVQQFNSRWIWTRNVFIRGNHESITPRCFQLGRKIFCSGMKLKHFLLYWHHSNVGAWQDVVWIKRGFSEKSFQ